MSFGKINCFIDIQDKVTAKDSASFSTPSYNTVASVRAYREKRHGSERWANMAAFSTASALFRFRKIPTLDVTTKQDHCSTYNPILLNSQTNKALRDLENYKTILPLSCKLHETSCFATCFTQQFFIVSHSQRANDISKVAYRIITNAIFAEQLGQPDISAKYLIGKDKICCYTESNDKKADSYLLEN